MISGPITTGGGSISMVEVRRGMRILNRDGGDAGKIAAVAVGAGGLAAYLLQCHLPDAPEYRKVDLEFVEQVGEDSIRLSLNSEEVEDLPVWQSSGS